MVSETVYEQAAKDLDKILKDPVRQMMKGRLLFAKTYQLPAGKMTVEKFTWTDMGASSIAYSLPEGELNRDSGYVGVGEVKVPLNYKGWMVSKTEFDSMKNEGFDLVAKNAESAAYQIALREDDMIFLGWAPDGTNYQVEGLYTDAGNDYSTGKDFGTFGNPTDAIAGAFALLDADNIGGVNFNLGLNPAQYRELQASRSANGVREWPDILDMLNSSGNPAKGTIYWSNDITAASGLMSPVDTSGKYIDLVIAMDMQNIMGVDSKLGSISPVYGLTIEAVRPRVHQDTSLCKLSAI